MTYTAFIPKGSPDMRTTFNCSNDGAAMRYASKFLGPKLKDKILEDSVIVLKVQGSTAAFVTVSIRVNGKWKDEYGMWKAGEVVDTSKGN